jgi:hypothetical protein
MWVATALRASQLGDMIPYFTRNYPSCGSMLLNSRCYSETAHELIFLEIREELNGTKSTCR